MFSRHLTYTEKVLLRRKRARFLLFSFLVLAGISIVHAFFLASYTVSHDARAIGFSKAERVLATPLTFGPDTILGRLPALRKPKAGEAIVVAAGQSPFESAARRLWLNMVRFFTLQLLGEPQTISIGIVQAVPGQNISQGNASYTLDQDEALVKFASSAGQGTGYGTAIVKLSEIRASILLVYWPLKQIRVP